MRGKKIIKIVFSLLIAVSFILTSTSVIGSNISTEDVKASAIPEKIQAIEKIENGKSAIVSSVDAPSIIPLSAGPTVVVGYDPSAVKNAQVRYRNFKTQGNGWDYAIGTDVGVAGFMNSVDWTYSADWFFNPSYNTISFVYDGSTKVYTNVVANGISYTSYAEYLTGDLDTLNYMQWLVRGDTGQTVNFYDVVLTVGANTYPLGSFSQTASTTTWSISNFDLSGGFILTGKIMITGQATCQECGKVDIVIGDLPYNGPFPVAVTAISVDGIDRDTGDVIASGTYPLDVTVTRLLWPDDEQQCGPAEVKKFIEVFKKKTIAGTPDTVKDLYCEDFEDPCEIALNWSTIDMPVWGYNGALDTWTWSAKRYASPGHSMRSTSFDQYLPNQWDILELGFGGAGLDVSAYDNINITWKQFVEGDFQGTSLQDYGYFEYSYDDAIWTQAGINYYDSNGAWETITLSMPTTGEDTMYFRWTWLSDPLFCYEGWYIDDVCLTGIIGGTPGTTTWEFVMDSYSYPQVIEGPFEKYTFNESWTAVEGEYRICAWIQALDECHIALTEYDTPYCIYITIGNHLELELECDSIDMTPPSPAFDGDDVIETVNVTNIGTLDATNVQVQMTVHRGSYQEVYATGFEDGVNEPDGLIPMAPATASNDNLTKWVRANPLGRSYAHYTTYDQSGGTKALANFNEVGLNPWRYNNLYTSDWIRGPVDWTGSVARDMGITATFNAIANFGAGDSFRFGVMNWDTGWSNLYQVSASPYYFDWTNFEYDVSFLIGDLQDAGAPYTTGPNNRYGLAFRIQKADLAGNSNPLCPWDNLWSGFILDDISVTSLVAEPEVIYQQVNVIPWLNITAPGGPKNNTEFNWSDAGVGTYVIYTDILTADEDLTNNQCITPYNIINVIDEPKDIVCVDYTGPGQGHWVEEGCCGGYFWCGDPVTTQYGINWSDALYLRNATGGLTFDLSGYLSVNIEFDTWFQLSANDFGYLQVSNDGGLGWTTVGQFNGNSTDPWWGSDVFGWFHYTIFVGTSTTMQFRFLFESNATGVNRGWIVDNIEVSDGGSGIIFGPDPCLNFNKFYRHEKQYGCWWQQPWIFDYFIYDVPIGIPDLPGYGNNAFDPSWGVYDPYIYLHTYPPRQYNPTRPWLGAAPDNLDTALIMTFDTADAFMGWFETTTYYDTDASDHGYIEIFNGTGWDIVSDDSGSANDDYQGGLLSLTSVIANDYQYWAGKSISLNDYMDQDQVKIRFRYTSNESNLHRYSGFGMLGGVYFYGMKDLNPPVTTLQMSGTFDETYHYYTSAVKMKLTATDDITGVAHTYYKLDGVQSEYTGLVTINTDGDHTFCYWSVDNEGNVEAEKCVPSFRIDLTGPSVTITGPTAGLYLFGSQILPLSSGKIIFLFGGIPVTATATSTEAPIQVVRFYLDDVLLAEDSTAPYAATLSAKHSGAAVIKVTARDVLGHEASATLNIDTYVKLI